MRGGGVLTLINRFLGLYFVTFLGVGVFLDIGDLQDLIESGVGRVKPNDSGLYDCPVCKKEVSAIDFISRYRLIEDGSGDYSVVNLCRDCRDSGAGGG